MAEAATLGVFFGGSFGLYNNVPGLELLWRPFRSRNGRDFMWNSGVFGVNTQRQGGRCTRRPAASSRPTPFSSSSAKARAPQVNSLASFGTALLPEEHGRPSPALLVDRVDRYLARMHGQGRRPGPLVTVDALYTYAAGRCPGCAQPSATVCCGGWQHSARTPARPWRP